jgi:hypothetical protein
MPDPSSDWNRPYKKHEECVPLDPALAEDPPVVYADGVPVGPGYVVPRDPGWHPTSRVHKCGDQPGTIRIDMTERVPGGAGGPDLYFHKGGQGYRPATVPYGHLAADFLAAAPPPHFTKPHLDAYGGDPGNNPPPGPGRAHPTTVATYEVVPRAIGPDSPAEAAWLYKNPLVYPANAAMGGARYSKYGDAGPTQGGRGEHFAYLCWSWLRTGTRADAGEKRYEVSGGGAIRALLRPGQIVHRCDVRSISSPAWDRAGNEVGRVVAIYARAEFGAVDLYGWMVHSHLVKTDTGWSRQMHVRKPRPGR